MNTRLGLLLWILLSRAVLASTPALDFELANSQGFVQLSRLIPQVTVVNFWRYDCPGCIRELPLLSTFAHVEALRVVTVALHRPADELGLSNNIRSSLGTPIMSLRGPRQAQGLLARFGNSSQALPYTVVLNSQRRMCARHLGEVNARWLHTAIENCVASPF